MLILQYACRLRRARAVTISHEHTEYTWLHLDALDGEPLPEGYLRGIRQAVWLLMKDKR